MSKKRWLVFILLIIAVVLAAVRFVVYRKNYRPEPVRISLDAYPRHVNSPIVTLQGQVSRFARIEVTRGPSTFTTELFAQNKFITKVELEPGENHILITATPMEFDPEVVEEKVFIVWEPQNPPVPTIHPLPYTTNVPEVTVSGTTFPHGQVEVLITPEDGGPRSTYFPRAIKDGSFKTPVNFMTPGTYKITAAARNFQNQKSEPSLERKVVYDPAWYPPTSQAQAPRVRRITRKADIVLTHKQMTMTLEVTLPRDDPAVTTLLADQSTVERFFGSIFGLTVNGSDDRDFADVVPQIVINDQDATITVTTSPYRAVRSHLPVLRGEFVVAGPRGFPFSSPDDSLSITTFDYTIESVGPPPTLFDKNKVTWKGSGVRPISTVDEILSTRQYLDEIKLQLAYEPFASPRNFLRLAQLNPYTAWPYPGNVIPHLVLGLLRLIPMLWVLWLVGDSLLTINPDLRNDLYKLSATLITLSLTETVLAISSGLGFFAIRFMPLTYLSGPFVRLQIAACLAVLVVALLVKLVLWRAAIRSWAIWLERISAGMIKAALISIVLHLTWFVGSYNVLARATCITIIVVALLVLFWRLAKVIRHGALTRTYKYRLAFLTLIVLLTFVIPYVAPAFTIDVRGNIIQSFVMLQSLLPYALVIGLLIVLKNVNALDQPHRRDLVLTIAAILFSGFVVGPSAHLFMIPVPFIISLILFKRFLIHDFDKCNDLDAVNNDVIRDRPRLIGDVLSYETAQHFQSHSEKLRDKVTSGDITLQEFEDRKSEIEKYAADKERASTHVNGLHAKTTVLGIGPHAEDWENGRWALKWAAAFIAPFLVVYLLLLLLRPDNFSGNVFGFMFGFNQLLFFVADWLLSAFFFGYFFRYIRGNSGLEKGLRIALALIICLAPTWLTGIANKTELLGVLFGAAQTFLFFTLLGMGAFDYATFRGALRNKFRWRTFARFGNMPSFVGVMSVLITSIGVGLTSVITGQFTDLLTTLLSAVFQQAPGPPR